MANAQGVQALIWVLPPVMRNGHKALGVVIKNTEILLRKVCLLEDKPTWLVVNPIAKNESCAWLLGIQLRYRRPYGDVDSLKRHLPQYLCCRQAYTEGAGFIAPLGAPLHVQLGVLRKRRFKHLKEYPSK
jgi:hypothetical protein